MPKIMKPSKSVRLIFSPKLSNWLDNFPLLTSQGQKPFIVPSFLLASGNLYQSQTRAAVLAGTARRTVKMIVPGIHMYC